jgi:DNA helicase IV
MELTKEQNDIIKSEGNIKINAVAGSGKTTTIVEYARNRPKGSMILYLAYNKSVKLEAIQKFKDKGLDNVKVETAHSLAFNYIIKNSNLINSQILNSRQK